MSDEGSVRESVQGGDGKEGIADARKRAKEIREGLKGCACMYGVRKGNV
jgi:hypothetical protein